MNKLPHAKRVQILSMLVEGSSMRPISRVVDVSINTVAKILTEAGEACEAFPVSYTHLPTRSSVASACPSGESHPHGASSGATAFLARWPLPRPKCQQWVGSCRSALAFLRQGLRHELSVTIVGSVSV